MAGRISVRRVGLAVSLGVEIVWLAVLVLRRGVLLAPVLRSLAGYFSGNNNASFKCSNFHKPFTDPMLQRN